MVNKITQWIKKLIAINLPRKGKRLICITLGYLIWSRSNNDDDIAQHELIELNNKLGLSNSDDSLRFVLGLNRILRNDTEINELYLLSPEDIKRKLVSYLPCWLKYADDDKIQKDLNVVFNPRYLHLA